MAGVGEAAAEWSEETVMKIGGELYARQTAGANLPATQTPGKPVPLPADGECSITPAEPPGAVKLMIRMSGEPGAPAVKLAAEDPSTV